MKNKIIYLFILFNANFASAQERLLPAVESDAISISSRQDGQAVYVYITNRSSMVLTFADIVCYEKTYAGPNGESQNSGKYSSLVTPPEESIKGKLKAELGERYYTPIRGRYTNLVRTEKAKVQYSGRLLPGKAEEVYLESKSVTELENCALSNNRGRAKRIYEIF